MGEDRHIGALFVPISTLTRVTDYVDWIIVTVRAEQGARGWTDEQLAEAAGTPYGSLRQWMRRSRGLPFSAVERLAHGFGMTPAAFLAEVQRRQSEGMGK